MLTLPSDTGINVGSYKILCPEDGTNVIRLSAAVGSSLSNSKPVEAVPHNNPAAKVQYQTGTT
jgi:hypothetical protein